MMIQKKLLLAVVSFCLFCVSVSANAETIQKPEFFVPSLQLEHETWINNLAMSDDGQVLATANWEKEKATSTLHLWNLENGQERKSWEVASGVIDAMVFSADGKTLAIGVQNTITLWNGQGEKLETLTGHSGDICSLQFSPNGKYLASGSLRVWNHNLAGELFLWDLKTKQKREVLMDEAGGAEAIAFSPDSSLIVTPQSISKVGIWNVETLQHILTLDADGRVVTIKFSSDAKTIATGDTGHGLKLWDANTGELKAILLKIDNNLAGMGPNGNVNGISFQPNAQTMISAGTNQEGPGGEAELLMWDLATHKILHSLKNNHAYGIRYFAASNDGKTLATAQSLNPTVKVYHLN